MVASFLREESSSHGGIQEVAFVAFRVENRVVVCSLHKTMFHSIWVYIAAKIGAHDTSAF